MGSPWKPILLLSVISGLSDITVAVAARPMSYAAVLRMKTGSSSSAFNLRGRPRQQQRGGGLAEPLDWPVFASHPHLGLGLLSSEEDYGSEESEEFGPFFILEPDDVIFPLTGGDNNVMMHCEARAKPPPTYSWYINGTQADTRSDLRLRLVEGNLIITNASEITDSGTYQCRAENIFGTVLSRDAHLQFAYVGTFSTKTRGAVSVREGQGVVLMCMPPPHSPEIIYSWVFNEYPSFVAEDSRRFISQVTGNLYVSKVQPSDVGSYICLLKNMATNARVLSPPTPLTLRTDGVMGEYEPKIEVHFPPSVLASRGVTVRLECFALGNPVPTITWRKINGNIPKKARLRKSQAVLEISNIQQEDSGTYECKAENSRGGASFKGHLQVYTLPQWVRMINDTQLDSGENLQWECKATGRPRPTYRWLRNGLPLTSQGRVEIVNGELSIHKLQPVDSGMYQCVAENKYGTIYSNAELKILALAPVFVPNPVRVLATLGKDAFIDCKPRASPKPQITWRRGVRSIQPNQRVMLLKNNTLRIINASRADEGDYVCRAQNQLGWADMTATLWVKEAMHVELNPRRVEVTVGESVVLSCKATHDISLDVTFQWLFDDRPITFQQPGGHFESIQTVHAKQSSTVDLMIRSILLKHAGKYGCRAQTSADTIIMEADLLVRGPPGPPGVVIMEEITETTATLSWIRGLDNHSPISTYHLQARNAFSLGWQTVKTDPMPVTGDLESAMAVDLNPWVEYEFRVVASNAIGTGDPSTPSRGVRTKEAAPSVAPTNVSGGNGRRHELVISWEPVSEEFQNGEGFGYIVAFRANGTRGWKEKMVTSPDSTTYKYRDETFPPLTPFEVKVGVYNNKGDGPFSPVVIIHSAEGEPREAPSDVKAYAISASQIRVTWKPPLPGPGRPKGYEVSYWKASEKEDSGWKQRTTKNETSMVLGGLEGNSLYELTVRGFNSIGQGPASTSVTAKTRKAPPVQPPGNLLWIQEGNNVSLSWDPVKAKENESDVIGYMVLLKQEGRGHNQVTRTINPSTTLSLPEGGTYAIEVRALSEGGEGAVSSQVRLVTSSGVRAKSCKCKPKLTWPVLLLVLLVPSASW
ncbi:contactin-5-like [Corythoichthys intestinalis]|uniref:contactin-5-like n=1 Tax=Corythoichthys intestinalis TaxID=161448 RepID=UPI0025A5D33C|nr:contactin-5-like [Corythoichthys intestinalis]XP_057684851.1 contactin-5-like [Corythoichthys intestinalis]XP_057684852.1 contactin-5-like [Corythoichthys intestinalis]XP_057684853.1 contactin-5-like [Corythoichthys intestinalis]